MPQPEQQELIQGAPVERPCALCGVYAHQCKVGSWERAELEAGGDCCEEFGGYKSDEWIAAAMARADADCAQLLAHLEKKHVDTALGFVVECQMCRHAAATARTEEGRGMGNRSLPF